MSKNTSIILGEHFDKFIQAQIKAGQFASASEVIRNGLRLLEQEVNKIAIINKALDVAEQSGDQALFGKSTQQMKSTWGIKSKPLADFMPTILLKAKDFATEITIFNAKEKRMKTERAISNEHITNNSSVRNTLLSRGITPEKLQPEEDINKVNRKLKSDDKKTLKNPDKLK